MTYQCDSPILDLVIAENLELANAPVSNIRRIMAQGGLFRENTVRSFDGSGMPMITSIAF